VIHTMGSTFRPGPFGDGQHCRIDITIPVFCWGRLNIHGDCEVLFQCDIPKEPEEMADYERYVAILHTFSTCTVSCIRDTPTSSEDQAPKGPTAKRTPL
ncbi:hypothetical protein KIPB_014777, partial [Kipferlia bialata]